ncbi:facilitated trehalose transporter Tret1-like [Photinus pyralis]|uniref:Major facilitator superfamily (MFS) profile domain-containing protein n=1 Tax=Photinus pyralis TaxID=7054 RepID=A0A1Y1KXX5_PHOPY|nr:facilitated trehalose transporter Tret1-like [Photinus pyralis]XP_031348944.1 facilitated trehalose transporter Tret1-like [Photinus pyralis]
MRQNKAKKLPQYLAGISVCMGAMAAGTVLGWTGNISKELELGALNDITIDEADVGWVGSISNLGGLLVCFPIGIICDFIGRKNATLLLTAPFLLGWILILFAQNLAMILAGRFIVGMAGGAFCVAAPLYTSEIAEKEIRGTLGSFFQLFVTCGIMLSYILGYAVSVKVFTIVMTAIPIIFCVSFAFQPETPIYRLKQKDEKEARYSLKRLRGSNYDPSHEIQELNAVLDELKNNNVKISDSLKKRSTKIAAIVSFSLMFFQQAGGVNAVIFYTSDIFTDSGSSLDPKEATMIVGAIQIIATFISSLVIDKLGRRILLLTSSLFMAVGLLILGAFFSLKLRGLADAETLETLGLLPIVGLCVFIIAFSLGFGPIPWMIASELFPSEIKSVASSIAGTLNWLMAFLITKFYGDMSASLGGDVTFYIFAGICLIGIVFVFFVVPETKDKTLAQIQRELNKETLGGIDNCGFQDKK